MARLLIVYGTTEGHTRKVAGRIAEVARGRGYAAAVIEAGLHPPPDRYDAVIVAASVHHLRHQASVTHFVREHLLTLRRLPTAFFSVSLTAALPDVDHQEEAGACVEDFLDETRWRPGATFLVGGALLYSKYDFFKRMLLKMIARQYGRDTDVTHDYEYTDWEKLQRDAEEFLDALDAYLAAQEQPIAETAEPELSTATA